MADWTNLPNTAVGVGGLPSGTTVTALRDNPVAIAEGAAGAPKVNGRALDKVFAGFLTFGTTGDGLSNLDNVGGLFFDLTYVSGSAGTQGADVRFSTDNGATWGAWQVFISSSVTSTTFSTRVHWDFNTQTQTARSSSIQSITIPVGVNAFQFRKGAGLPTLTGDFFIFGGAV